MNYATPYQKVLCRFYDQLELYSLQKRVVHITWKDADQDPQEVITRIKTLETRKSEEFLITQDDQWIRLDLITTLILQDEPEKLHVPLENSGSVASQK